MSKQILIHIGTHKTGTTSIQHFLAAHRALLMQCGAIYYPHSGTLGPTTGHHNIAWQFVGEARFKQKHGDIADLLRELNENDFRLAILSSEDFEHLTGSPDRIAALDHALRSTGFTTRYLAVFRETEIYAKSLFLELNKRGLEEDFSDFARKISERGFTAYSNRWHFEFDPQRFASVWNAACGEEKLEVIRYEEAVANDGIIAALLRSAGAVGPILDKARSARRYNQTSKRKKFLFRISQRLGNLFKGHLTSRP